MKVIQDIKLDYSDVLIRPKRSELSTRAEVSLIRTFNFKNSPVMFSGIPIMAANMDGIGSLELADALMNCQMFTCLVKSYDAETIIKYYQEEPDRTNYTAVSIGSSNDDLEKLIRIEKETSIKFVCIDVANGYSKKFTDFVKKVKETFPDLCILAGNVVTGEMVEDLILNGVDIVKIGIGPGSVCTTRIVTGVGYPQLSAVLECADAAHGVGGRIIADGGCTCPGDVVKAFAADADFVMLGGMLSGTNEGGGEILYENDHLWLRLGQPSPNAIPTRVRFYGMSSKIANEKHNGGLKDYRSSEGREILVPYKGPVKDIIDNILGGIRSASTYVGAKNLKDLPRCATFIRVNHQYNTFMLDSSS